MRWRLRSRMDLAAPRMLTVSSGLGAKTSTSTCQPVLSEVIFTIRVSLAQSRSAARPRTIPASRTMGLGVTVLARGAAVVVCTIWFIVVVSWHCLGGGGPAPRTGTESAAAGDDDVEEYLHLALANRGILLTPFHNMALMCPATTDADVDLHTQVFATVVAAITT